MKWFLLSVLCAAPFANVLIQVTTGIAQFKVFVYIGFGLLSLFLFWMFLQDAIKDHHALRSNRTESDSVFAVERHFIALRCFLAVVTLEEEIDIISLEEDQISEESDFYFDIGVQGTLMISGLYLGHRRPSSNITVIQMMRAEERMMSRQLRSEGVELVPVGQFRKRELEDLGVLSRFIGLESFTIIPESLDEVLGRFQIAADGNTI